MESNLLVDGLLRPNDAATDCLPDMISAPVIIDKSVTCEPASNAEGIIGCYYYS